MNASDVLLGFAALLVYCVVLFCGVAWCGVVWCGVERLGLLCCIETLECAVSLFSCLVNNLYLGL